MSWLIRSLTEVAPINARKPELFDGTRRYYSTGAVGKNGELDTPELVTFAERPSRANCMPKTGDVGFARMNGTQKVVLVSEAELGSLFSTGFCFLEPNDALDSKYLFYFLTSEGFQSEKNALAGEGIMGGIKNSDVANMQIVLPPLSEQQRIVRLLDEAFEGIAVAKANAEENLQNARALFESHLQSIFTKGGKGWADRPLIELCSVFEDGDWIESKDQSSGGIRLIQTGNVGQGMFKDRAGKARFISESTFNTLRCTEIFSGDCLVSRLPDPVGRSCIIPSTTEKMITAVDCTILRFKKDVLVPEYFVYYSQSSTYLSSIAKLCTGTTRNRISRSNLGLTSIPVPSITDQRKIIEFLMQIERQTQALEAAYSKKLTMLEEFSKSLLREAFAGALKVA